MEAHQRARVARLEPLADGVQRARIEAAHQVYAHPAGHPGHEPDDRAPPEADPERPRHGVRRAHGRDRGGAVLRIARRAHGQDVVLEQLEQHAELEPHPHVAQDHAGDRPRDDRARDHHLRYAHQVQAHERAPREQPQLQLEAHVNCSSGTGVAVGTSCAVTSTPCAASARSFAASSSLRYT